MTRILITDTGGRQYFDIDKATTIKGAYEWDGDNMASVHVGRSRHQNLILTAGGRWVLNSWSSYNGEAETYAYVSADDAKAWLTVNGSDDLLAKHFGPVPEEVGPGRPSVGPMVNVRLPQALVDRLDAAAGDGEPRAAVIRRLLWEALGPEATDADDTIL